MFGSGCVYINVGLGFAAGSHVSTSNMTCVCHCSLTVVVLQCNKMRKVTFTYINFIYIDSIWLDDNEIMMIITGVMLWDGNLFLLQI